MTDGFHDRDGYCLQCYDKKIFHNADGCMRVGCNCPVPNPYIPNFKPKPKVNIEDFDFRRAFD